MRHPRLPMPKRGRRGWLDWRMALDVDKARADTPSCLGQNFLDNAGSALSPSAVNEAVIAHLDAEQTVGGYVAAAGAADRINQVSEDIATLVDTTQDNVALQVSATEAWRRAISAIPFQPGDRVLTTSAEYASNVIPLLQAQQQSGISIEVIPDGPDGAADPAAFALMLDSSVKAVCITHAPSQNGLVTDAEAFGQAIADSGFAPWYLLDACQSIGQLPVSLADTRADFLTATGRKWLRGPRGSGFLAVSDRVLAELEPNPADMFGTLWDGERGFTMSATATRFQSFETSYAAVLGLGQAVKYAHAVGIADARSHIDQLAQTLRAQLAGIPGVRSVDRGTVRSGIVVFALPEGDPIEMAAALRGRGVTVTPIGSATNPVDIARFDSSCALRASPHIYNTKADIDALCTAVADLAS